MTSEPDLKSKTQISPKSKGETPSFPAIDASGLAPAELGRAIALRVEQGDQVVSILNLNEVSHSTVASQNHPPLDISSIITVINGHLAESHLGRAGQREVSILQHEVVYTGVRHGERLDVVTFKPNIAGATGIHAKRSGSVVAPGPEIHGQTPAFSERRDQMADKQEQSHFMQQVVKGLEPHFNALKAESAQISAGLKQVRSSLTEHGIIVSATERNLKEYYDLTIAHNQTLENELASLRKEMNDNSAKTNALLETIAASLTERSS